VSDSFQAGANIPQKHVFNGMGCTGENVSPHLRWSGVPDGTKSFAVVMHDPDAPTSGGFYHWVMFNIPADRTELEDGAGGDKIGSLVHHVVLGHTDFGANAYGGPCPPPGPAHRYNITVYALDIDKLPLDKTTTGAKLEFMASQHALGKATISGRYART
jgi:Raf kinase inhibitor-like YbhB/YbcL family protein